MTSVLLESLGTRMGCRLMILYEFFSLFFAIVLFPLFCITISWEVLLIEFV